MKEANWFMSISDLINNVSLSKYFKHIRISKYSNLLMNKGIPSEFSYAVCAVWDRIPNTYLH